MLFLINEYSFLKLWDDDVIRRVERERDYDT